MRAVRNEGLAPVAIIGGGVVGLSMALALARQNISSVVLDRGKGPNDHPRAHVANPRTLELFRLWGIENAVRAAGLPATTVGNFVWLTALAGTRLGEISYERDGESFPEREAATLTPEVSCAQDVIESILARRLRELTGQAVEYNATVTSAVTQEAGGVAITIAGRAEPLLVRYAIAADGAGSSTREQLAIPMEGPDELARFVSIYLHADFSRWVGDSPAVLYWIVNSRVQGVFISMDGVERYVFHVRIDSGCDFADYTPDRARALVHDAVGAEAAVEIKKVGQWVMSGQVAEHFRSGNILLAGDSAHRFPPTGGFGMNTGIQDAHNLAWKLAAVLKGWAPEALLDSYETERRPVADANRSRSVSNFLRLESLASWSRDPAPIVERLESPGQVGVEERIRFKAEVERQRDHFDKLEQELGFVYRTGAVARNGAQGDAASSLGASVIAKAEVGARLPLVRLTWPDGSAAATTDLVECEFVLFANGSPSWREATARVAAGGVPIRCLDVGSDLLDPHATWSASSRTEVGGALLVRPDGHIAFRCVSLPKDPTAMLTGVISTLLASNRGR